MPTRDDVARRKWTLEIHTDATGDTYATLREPGKMDTVLWIRPEQAPWFNALRNLLPHSYIQELKL